MKLSLVITTYNRPDALELVLLSAAGQKRLPDEVVIADDGSGPETRELVERVAREFPVPLHHAWQEDEGWRVSRVRNIGIAKTTGDYVVIIDGDMVLHPWFLADHERAAKPGVYGQGTRAMLGPDATQRMIRDRIVGVGIFSRDLTRRRNALRAPLLGIASGWPRRSVHYAKGCNMGMWRSDLDRVNGFNEGFESWGREDNEFVNRLIHAGIKRRFLRFRALAFHLHHEVEPQDGIERNDEIMMQTVNERLIRCERGLDQHC